MISSDLKNSYKSGKIQGIYTWIDTDVQKNTITAIAKHTGKAEDALIACMQDTLNSPENHFFQFYEDGKKLLISSNRNPESNEETKPDFDIWYCDREGNNWSNQLNPEMKIILKALISIR